MVPTGATLWDMTFGLAWRAMAPRFLLTFFLLLQVLPLILSVPLRNEDQYYMNGNIRCLRCPPGNYVAKDCDTRDTMGTCVTCHSGRTYSEHLTGINHCLTCTRCRDDQEEVSPCTIAKNTICRCKKGTFCPPDHPCEICLACTTSCPPDQVMKAPCNSTSDTECGPTDPSSGRTIAIICGVLGTMVIICVVVYLCFLRKRTSAKNSKLWSKILQVCPCTPDESSEEDTDTKLLPTVTTLVFEEGTNAETREQIIMKTFDIFVDKVPVAEFDKFMRHLGLTPNKIVIAKIDNPSNVSNQHYTMLQQWQQENLFDINVLLRTLHKIKMGTVAAEITEKLIQDELFVRQTQS
ncbi:tumor necrosis factor receptor superfamily member 10B-like [Mixophyes fleayi]|uniref:tumor necrosis factor receptor superfamily member 10B-like n=1 Tax=Mixophyes fleayi TaxID=3061075 RepID=UPI003F4DB680